MTNNEGTVLVRINKGYGSHTSMKHVVDEAGEKVQQGVIYRSTDEDAFELSASVYEEFSAKFALCDPETGDLLTPTIQAAKATNMANKVAAAAKKSASRKGSLPSKVVAR